jgi:sulfofructose kinase
MTTTPFDVVGVGINSVDHVAVLPAFPEPVGPRAKMRIRRHATLCGGQTATALVACARFGLRAAYVGAIGADGNGCLVRETLSGASVDLSHLVVRDAVNRFAIILLDESTGERVILWDFDERLRLADEDIPASALETARLVHVDDVDERAALAAARIARSAKVPITSDIDRVTEVTRELARAPGANQEPGVRMEDRQPRATLDDVRDAMAAMSRRPEQTLCVTLGARGAMALDAGGFHYQPAFPIAAVDTTAAGDVFRAGFILARLRGYPIGEQLRWASAAAAASCTKLGAIASVPSLEEVEGLLQRT